MRELVPWNQTFWDDHADKLNRKKTYVGGGSDWFIYRIGWGEQDRYWAFRKVWGRKLSRRRPVFRSVRNWVCSYYGFGSVTLGQIVKRQLTWICLFRAVAKDPYFRDHPNDARAVFTDWIRRSKLVRTTEKGPAFLDVCLRVFERRFPYIDQAKLMINVNRWFNMLGQLEPTHAPRRTRHVSQATVRRVLAVAAQHPRPSCRAIAQRIRAKGMKVSHATVQRIIRRPEAYRNWSDDATAGSTLRRNAERNVWRLARKEASALLAVGWRDPRWLVRRREGRMGGCGRRGPSKRVLRAMAIARRRLRARESTPPSTQGCTG